MARPMPVLPLVASITVCPGLSLPVFSASSITPRARRSLTEPSGLNASILTKRFISGGASLLILTTGVLPTVSRMLAYLCPMDGSSLLVQDNPFHDHCEIEEPRSKEIIRCKIAVLIEVNFMDDLVKRSR